MDILCRVVPFVGQQAEVGTQVNKHSKTQGLTKSASKGTYPLTCLPVYKICPEDVSWKSVACIIQCFVRNTIKTTKCRLNT